MRDFQFPGRSPVLATEGMCATSHPLAAQAAIRILQDGGNAVDAAIAGAVLLGFAEPQSCGIGGDCFVLLKPAGDDRIVALNGSGRAPAGLSAAALRDRGLAAIGTESIESVTVPGAVDALCRLSEDWGRVGMAASLAPAIHYAEAGVPVAPRVAFDWPEAETRLSGAARGFYLDQGKALCVGQVFRSPGQAEVLRRIASEGRAGFYSGEVAEDMVASLKAAGGSHTLEDFAATACAYTDPVSGSYRDHDLVEHPPNGQGATAILMLNILSHFDLPSLDPLGAARAHLEAEATRLAYDARDRFIADPDHTSRLGHMLAPETAAGLAALIDPSRAMDRVTERTEAVHRDTVYITVVDRDRMAVSLIYSTYWGFGSGIASDRFGILFQNRGAGFTLTPGHPNEAGGGKRPMHTIIPAMLCQGGRVRMPFGVMGGAYQPTGHARFVTNHLDYGMNLQAALDAPRAFAVDGSLKLERGYSPSVAAELEAMGHRVIEADEPLGGGQAIRIEDSGVLTGASDPRKDGCALGY
ncbi:gamma-glutamyltransferase family protein [Albidovulum sp.]|uniref:gamma-glutamyltransferase family protein n=1 Tax=Albidovulum sp. TaxID=1872424 RepID=UPI001D667E6C|nr:gamma-glutamyltransferase family protein [Paracoccaceae bacterium]MCC0045738.1 gamma-glutamyltransferase family protein [Defluviimonas sp.]HPE26705.1 gamma-glutamyltransferase family protein [Albidovulum sp.]MCB2119959.1 gamma-glutamyltransferase family protein [Paracoccaceae bacterium]MCB2122546.1 gamma-glutamyltransferase family protein [Paracoccaceae bacterium]